MRWCLPLVFSLWAGMATADALEVDVELFLAVDVSRSMSPAELEIQRRGYAEALRSNDVVHAIRNGLIGRIALTYVEWAGAGSQRIIIDWTLIEGRADAEAFAERLTNAFDPALRRTSISGVLGFAARSIERNSYQGLRRVIDVSGDGPNNQGMRVEIARDQTLEKGIIINGLPLMTRDGVGSQWHLDDLDDYYRACVIGGPGSFAIPVLDWSEFAEAVRRKLVLEIVSLPNHIQPAASHRIPEYDCLIGEKLWEQLRRDWWDN